MNFKDEAIKKMYDALQDFLRSSCLENGKLVKCAANDRDFQEGFKAIKKAEKEMPWLKSV